MKEPHQRRAEHHRTESEHPGPEEPERVDDDAGDDPDLRQGTVAADQREQEECDREEQEPDEPAPPPRMRQVWFHVAVSDAARPVPAQSSPTTPMRLDATFHYRVGDRRC